MSTESKDGGPAFPSDDQPQPDGTIEWGYRGMTLRDWYAGQALAGVIAIFGKDYSDPYGAIKRDQYGVVGTAYEIADAMLAARKGDRP